MPSIVRFVFRRIAESRLLLGISIATMCISVLGTFQLCQPMVALLLLEQASTLKQHPETKHMIPDARYWGYTVEELNAFYDALGFEGCQLYIAVETWDLVPSMISYTVCLGTFLTLLAQRYHVSDHLSLLASMVWILDIIETVIQRHGCRIYPDRLPEPYIRLASKAVQWKWKLASTSMLLVIAGGMHILWKKWTVQTMKKQQ